MPQSMPEYALTRTYLELMVELPWNKSTKVRYRPNGTTCSLVNEHYVTQVQILLVSPADCLDIHMARVLLDSDHYAMEKLKKRVLEYLAVRQLKNSLKEPILCFVGPSGVGKTSVGHSIAKMLGREFHRIALGGVRREKVLESLSSTADLTLPLKMPIVMDRHTLKDILGLPIFEMQGCHAKPQDSRVHMLTSKLSKPAV
ncbi:Lon protease-like 2, peroxisomal [Acipenser ruthenus]|uniref:Lon protease-like 2, peroxisomal n=1 Tax=Acipenser ruthenus TaxID=7906 RepID=A0A444UL50_ACIRT|nr:Lon protease-like 2, peroxisomal [Acipenser ruthenus]